VVGGLAEPAIDRSARLADGHFAYAFLDPEREFALLWNERLRPALERHGRDVRAFRFSAAVVLWASDDAEREWRETVGPAFLYQQRKYAEWDAGEERAEGYLESDPALTDLDAVRERMLVGTPESIAERLVALHAACRLDELVFWARLPGVPHDMAVAHLERLAERVLPAVRDLGAG
jgi:alkanesulfonate monooxygenase SsuD/methylene tetrahydromethanopterin reductase-like flavin-dependent oxidoreductase (luciferase family)